MHALVTPYRAEEPSRVPAAPRWLTLVNRRHDRSLVVEIFDGPAPRDSYDVAVYQLVPGRALRYARVGVHHGDPMRDVSPAPLLGIGGLAGAMMLIDRTSGRGLGFVFFDTHEAMLRGDELVTAAPPGTAGPTSSVELYEVVGFKA
jgi:hypothetical protein